MIANHSYPMGQLGRLTDFENQGGLIIEWSLRTAHNRSGCHPPPIWLAPRGTKVPGHRCASTARLNSWEEARRLFSGCGAN